MNPGQPRIPDGDLVIYDDCDEACRYQIARIRQWATSEHLTFVPLTDPRVLLWFGDQNESMSPGTIAFIGADGTRAFGAEALEWIIHRLPSGQSTMLAAAREEVLRHRAKRLYSGMLGDVPKDVAYGAGPAPPQSGDDGSRSQVDRTDH